MIGFQVVRRWREFHAGKELHGIQAGKHRADVGCIQRVSVEQLRFAIRRNLIGDAQIKCVFACGIVYITELGNRFFRKDFVLLRVVVRFAEREPLNLRIVGGVHGIDDLRRYQRLGGFENRIGNGCGNDIHRVAVGALDVIAVARDDCRTHINGIDRIGGAHRTVRGGLPFGNGEFGGRLRVVHGSVFVGHGCKSVNGVVDVAVFVVRHGGVGKVEFLHRERIPATDAKACIERLVAGSAGVNTVHRNDYDGSIFHRFAIDRPISILVGDFHRIGLCLPNAGIHHDARAGDRSAELLVTLGIHNGVGFVFTRCGVDTVLVAADVGLIDQILHAVRSRSVVVESVVLDQSHFLALFVVERVKPGGFVFFDDIFDGLFLARFVSEGVFERINADEAVRHGKRDRKRDDDRGKHDRCDALTAQHRAATVAGLFLFGRLRNGCFGFHANLPVKKSFLSELRCVLPCCHCAQRRRTRTQMPRPVAVSAGRSANTTVRAVLPAAV